MEMHAIVKAGEGPGVEWRRVPVPDPGPDEVLVRVTASAVCGTDLHIAQWNAWARNAGIRLPLVMGHEFCGEVVGTGSRVRALKPGAYVAGETHLPCGACYQCRNGLQHICGNLKLFGIHRDGCFAEYATIPEQCAYPVPATIPPRIAAMLEPLGTSLRAVLEMDVSGGSVVVIGCGPIGLFAIASARALGASRIIGLDVREERLGLARKVGCGLMLDPLPHGCHGAHPRGHRRGGGRCDHRGVRERCGAGERLPLPAQGGSLRADRVALSPRPVESRAGCHLQGGHDRRHPRTGDVSHLDPDAGALVERTPECGSGRHARDAAVGSRGGPRPPRERAKEARSSWSPEERQRPEPTDGPGDDH